MKKILLLFATALMGMSMQAQSDVTVVSVSPEAGSTVSDHGQVFTVTFSSAVRIDGTYSGLYTSGSYGTLLATQIAANSDSTVWTFNLDPSDTQVNADTKSFDLKFGGTDANGAKLAGTDEIIVDIDWETWEYIYASVWSYTYQYAEVHGVSDVTLLSITPTLGTHIGTKSQQFVATFSAGVKLEMGSQKTGLYASAEGSRNRLDIIAESNEDGTVWTITTNPESYSNDYYLDDADSLFFRLRGYDLKGDSLQAGAIHYHNEYEDWMGETVVDDYYYYETAYSWGTQYKVGFLPADEDGEQYAKVSQFDQFQLVMPEGYQFNEACTEVIEVYAYPLRDNVATFTAANAQAEGNVLTFTLPEPQTTNGNYRVSVPSAFFIMPDGCESRSCTGYVYVKGIAYTWKPTSMNPAAGNVTNLETIDLNFESYTEYNPETAHAELRDQDGNVASTITWGYKGNDGLGITLSLDQSIEGKFGTYNLVIDQASFGNQTWVDEAYTYDGKANPTLTYEYVLYDENNVTLTKTLPVTIFFQTSGYDDNWMVSQDTIESYLEFYDNGTNILKKFAGRPKYDLQYDFATGAVKNYTEIEEVSEYYSYWVVPTGREDIPALRFEVDGWNTYNGWFTNSSWAEYYGYPADTRLSYISCHAFDANGDCIYRYGQVTWIYIPGSEESIETVRRDGSDVARFYRLDGRPAKAEDKGMLIMVRNGESSRIYRM